MVYLKWSAVAQYTSLANSVLLNLALSAVLTASGYAEYSVALASVLLCVSITDAGMNVLLTWRGVDGDVRDLQAIKWGGAGAACVLATILTGLHVLPAIFLIPCFLVAFAVPAYSSVETLLLGRSWRSAALVRLVLAALTLGGVLGGAVTGLQPSQLVLIYGLAFAATAIGASLMLEDRAQILRMNRPAVRHVWTAAALASPTNLLSNGFVVLAAFAMSETDVAATRLALLGIVGLSSVMPFAPVHLAALAQREGLQPVDALLKQIASFVVVAAVAAGSAAMFAEAYINLTPTYERAFHLAGPALLAVPAFLLAGWLNAAGFGVSTTPTAARQGAATVVSASLFVVLAADAQTALFVAILVASLPPAVVQLMRLRVLLPSAARVWAGALSITVAAGAAFTGLSASA